MTGILLAVTLLAQANPVVDNQRVRVWHESVVLSKDLDAVSVTVKGDSAKAVFLKKGTKRPNAAATLTVELKETVVPPLANTSGFPNAFPRPGIKKLLENDRVVVWNYSWTLNSPVPVHFHDKDVIVMYFEDGDLLSTVPDGTKTLNEYKPGMIRFNQRDRVHTEMLTRGKQRAIMVELK